MKKLIYLLFTFSLVVLPFTSCSDDDDEKEKDGVPVEMVSSPEFTDTDNEEGKIGGTLSWTLPESEANITGYVIYLSDSQSEKANKLGDVSAGVTSFTVASGTDFAAYLLIVAKNAAGESDNVASVTVKDIYKDVPRNVAFKDTDITYTKISGTVSWTAPAGGTDFGGYLIYLSDEQDELGTKIGEVANDATSFEIPDGTDFYTYLHVAVMEASADEIYKTTIPVTDSFNGAFILNRGNQGANNASIGYYDFTSNRLLSENIYPEANGGSDLGDSAEALLIYGSKLYVTVYGSNRIVVLDTRGKVIKSLEPTDDQSATVGPRCMAAADGNVYIGYYSNHAVAALDTASLEIRDKVSVGRYPEQLAIANNKIYVANSGGMDYPNYGETVSVIDMTSFKVEDEIKVVINPNKIIPNSQGDLYVISWGDWGTIKNTLQRIDVATGEVTVIGNATEASLVNDKLYTLFAQYGEPEYKYVQYNALTANVLEERFIDNTSINNPLVIDVDQVTGKIFICNYDYVSTSTMYIFNSNGTFEKTFETGGYYTGGTYFYNR
ncbi:MAG: hypothetical protein LUD02_13290 [Tannerellaceae bacterium]|nr:hypothetical protein [Tannerellaceae bacterium]MCD8264997.1 hypothetical protein [Tannerellaceae bacterium]